MKTLQCLRRAMLAALLMAAFGPFSVAEEEIYQIDPVHSSVNFKIRHLVSRTTGKFTDFSGVIRFDEKNMKQSSVEAVIAAASIDTENKNRDEHLRSADFFETEKFPEIRFKSKKVVPGKKNSFKLIGDFTMHGVTKEITLEAEFLGKAAMREGQPPKAGFTATGVIQRSEFGISTYPGALGEDVSISLEIEANPVLEEESASAKGEASAQ
jgi:polyisoprenoid-binding protein YceI